MDIVQTLYEIPALGLLFQLIGYLITSPRAPAASPPGG